jgi:hypothetical protein
MRCSPFKASRSRCKLNLEHTLRKTIERDFLSAINQKTRQQSASALLACYEQLSVQKQHLLHPLLHDVTPKQWQHYPDSDVIDTSSGYQYFYHSHSPEDRLDSPEHGHFHVFARLDGEKHVINEDAETKFLHDLRADSAGQSTTANLLCISLDAKGVPMSIFTVNRWVTGGHFLSASTTLALLKGFKVATPGFEVVNQWLEAMLGLFWPQIVELLVQRDLRLLSLAETRRTKDDLLEDHRIELLSDIAIDIDCSISLLD